jgi:glyoxylase-like metal-dependent hydrolase (beta-lactamase superfamily II)
MKPRLLSIAIGLVLASASLPALAGGPVDVPAGQAMSLGTMKLSIVRAGRLEIPNDGSVFGLNHSPAAVSALLRSAGRPTGEIMLDIDVLLVRTKDHVALIDTGYGPKNKSVLMRSLALAGVSPLEITDILITHAHPDHVGGLIDDSGELAFPNATIRMSTNEWRFMRGQKESKDILKAVRGHVRTFAPGGEVLPHIRSIALFGHTPGHVMYELSSNGERLLDLGDTAHSSVISLLRPDWALAWDSNQSLAAGQRDRELQKLARSHERMFAVHFPFPGVGFIEHKGRAFAFVPSLPKKLR